MIREVNVIGLLALLLTTGCVNSTVSSPALVQSHKAYEMIKKDRAINLYAAPSLFQAGKLYTLSKTAKSDAEADHFAYLLKQEVAVAKESARAKQLAEKIAVLQNNKTKALLNIKEDALQKAQEEAARAKEDSLDMQRKYQELQELNAKMTSRGLVLTLGDVLFENDKASLMAGAARAMDKLVNFLMENDTRKILIEGHTDNVGATTYNIDLSLRRADAVKNALVSKGIDSGRIVTKGYGEQYPVAGNGDSAGRQQNRRVEIVILNEGEMLEDVIR